MNLLLIWPIFSACNSSEVESKILINGILSDRYYDAMDVRADYSTMDSDHVAIIIANYQKSFIKDAEVIILSDSQNISLVAVQEGDLTLYKDINEKLRVVPGETYQLKVTLSDGKTFNARTRVPLTPTILSPIDGDTLDPSTGYVLGPHDVGVIPLEINIDPKSPVKFYIYRSYYGVNQILVHRYAIRQPDSVYFAINSEGLFILKIDVLTLDSALSKFSWFFSKYPFGADSLYAAMYDQHLIKPLEAFSNIEGEGGIGCFGSYTSTNVEYYVKQ